MNHCIKMFCLFMWKHWVRHCVYPHETVEHQLPYCEEHIDVTESSLPFNPIFRVYFVIAIN